MLSVKSYHASHVDQVRERIASALAVMPDDPLVINEMIVALDASFVHRMRGQEGKDGNPLNELRMLTYSIVTNGGVLAIDPTIKYDPSRSVAGIEVGDTIAVDRAMFDKLAKAVIAEIRKRFPS